jgi:small conductance mechanosensitive channel
MSPSLPSGRPGPVLVTGLFVAAFTLWPVTGACAGQDAVQVDTLVPDSPAVDTLSVADTVAPPEADPVAELLAIFSRIDGLREIEVRREGSILELTGTALASEYRVRAGTLAESVEGVRYVDNRIEVERELGKRLAPILERLQQKGMDFLQFLPLLTVGLILLGITFALAALAGRPRFPYDRLTKNAFGANVLRQAVRAVIILTGLLLTLELLAATALVGAVLGTAGVAGLAVGFAFRDIVENYLAGVILSLRQPFAPNDHIQLAGHEGKVVRLTSRDTILMTLDGNHVRIPNATVFKSIMVNLTRNPRRRFLIQIGIGPNEDIGAAIRTGTEAVLALPGILEHPPVTGRVLELGSSSVELRFAGWVNQQEADYGKVRSQAVRALRDSLATAGIATPAPEYGVRLLGDASSPTAELPASAPTPASADTESPARASLEEGTGDPSSLQEPIDIEPERPVEEPIDVEPERYIEEQIEEDLADPDEENLLVEPKAPRSP